ncbi:uncharacterized protein LOC111332607 [Stylophora pistillata]|uniref:uncharacterized protein LOC111332607 n=1 Tax=Stylophora pistillata TaxID=50429 RepID=UPI000C03BE61|nr:uncharacterized protein LOC111332607 [Stylophora pistillata]
MGAGQCANLNIVVPQEGELLGPYLANCVIMSILSITSVIGNVLILVSICRAPEFLRQPSYFLLVNLTVADLCVGFIAEPLYLIYKISYLINPLSVTSCYAGYVFNLVSFLLTSLSLSTAAAISLDRLMALHLHMKYTSIVTKQRVVILIAILLVFSLAFASMFEWAIDEQNTVLACANSLALVVALLSYVRIFQILRYHQRQISSHQVGEISSFTYGGEVDSMGTSFQGEEIRGNQREATKEIDGNRRNVMRRDDKQIAEKSEEHYQIPDGENPVKNNKQLQTKASFVSRENHGCFDSKEDLENVRFDGELKIVEDKGQEQEKEMHLRFGSTIAHLGERTLDHSREGEIDVRQIEEGNEKLIRVDVNEGRRKGETSSKMNHECPIEMTAFNSLRADRKAPPSNQMEGENFVLEEKHNESRSSEGEIHFNGSKKNQNRLFTTVAASMRQTTQEMTHEMTGNPVTIVDHDRINTDTNAQSDIIIINRKNKLRMRKFQKSFYNMFVIWFLMLLCYLPLICTSILFLLIGRSYSMHLAFNFTTSVMFMNSSINPVLFCWRIREFRAAVKKTLKELFGLWSDRST